MFQQLRGMEARRRLVVISLGRNLPLAEATDLTSGFPDHLCRA